MTTSSLDVAWLTICGILVFIMQAGFLCLEAGATRSKNRINVIIKNLTDLGLSVIIFWAIGYGLMFGNSWQGIIGVDRFLPNLGENKDLWAGSFFLFQAMFCSTAVTILSGATAERLRFKGYLAITLLISGLIYPVFGHWVWQGIDRGLPGGWLAQRGFVDFAGSSVVHSVGGWCSLAAVLVVGPRLGRFSHKRQFDEMGSTDLPVAFLGTMLLWFGWFGFNGGSNLVFDAQVSSVIANTLIAGAAGVVTPIGVMSLRQRPTEIKPMMNGAIAALVAVTSGCHAFSSVDALLVGAIGSVLMMYASHVLEQQKIDDVVGAIPVHLVAGLWGTFAVGIFGNLETLGTGLDRLTQLKVQLAGILACGIWSFGMCLIGLLMINRVFGLRVPARHEYIGLNITEHGTKSQATDVFDIMNYHAKTGDLRRRIKSDSFTEVGRVGQWYNQVIAALETAVAINDGIIRTAVDGILTIDCENTAGELIIKSVNPSMGKLFGYELNELVGQPFQILLVRSKASSEGASGDFSGDLSPAWLTHITQAATPQPMTGQHRYGRIFPIEITATETVAAGQRFFTVFLKDISARRLAEDALLDSRAQERAKAVALEQAMTQLKHTQAQLIQRERMAGQGQLVAGIAHEINNPATFIHGNLKHAKSYIEELLLAIGLYRRHSDRLPATVQLQLQSQLEAVDVDYIAADFPQLLASMQTGTDRIRTIVKELRNFSRHDESDLKSVDLHDSLDSALMVLAHRLKPTSTRPTISIDKQYGELPAVECYAGALNRAILSLLTNAVDAFDRAANRSIPQTVSPAIPSVISQVTEFPCITLITQQKGKQIFLAISNNGPHIPEDQQKQIFDPFFTTQPIGQGTGLGCTISYQIITEQHHGQLTCHSTADQDTCFMIEIPLVQTEQRSQTENARANYNATTVSEPVG